MQKNMLRVSTAFLTSVLTLSSSLSSFADDVVRLSGHAPRSQIMRAQDLGRKSSDEKIQLSIPLTLPNPDELKNFINELYDPASPKYHKFITPQEFADRFAQSENDVQQLQQYFTEQGLEVKSVHKNRMLMEVEGGIADVERAFQVEIHNFRTRDGKLVSATTTDPAVTPEVSSKIKGVFGLDGFMVWQPNYIQINTPKKETRSKDIGDKDASKSEGQNNSQSNGQEANLFQKSDCPTNPKLGFTPTQIRRAYEIDKIPGLHGTGESVALVQFDAYKTSDIRAYETTFGLPHVPLVNILVGGATGVPGSGSAEVTLDIESVIGTAPNIKQILVYEAPNSAAGLFAILSQIVTDNKAAVISTSWGIPEDLINATFVQSEQTFFMEMAAQGQTYFAASGDDGAYADRNSPGFLTVQDPSAQQYVTAVGGTRLVLEPNGAYGLETVWNNNNGKGGGGGNSTFWGAPSWQAGLANSKNDGASTQRMVPDVSLNSDPTTGYAIYFDGAWTQFGGTSVASPIWAGYAAIVNQKRTALGNNRIGFLNPTIYSIGKGAHYNSTFHDITIGDNRYFKAVKGYDLATGWGTPFGYALYNQLVTANVSYSQPIRITSARRSSVLGEMFPITATVASASDSNATPPTGTVKFKDGKNVITDCGAVPLNKRPPYKATCITDSFDIGLHKITAEYSGDGTHPAATSETIIGEVQYDFSIVPSSTYVAIGEPLTLRFEAPSSFGKDIEFSCANLPNDTTCNFSPSASISSIGSTQNITVTIEKIKSKSSATGNPSFDNSGKNSNGSDSSGSLFQLLILLSPKLLQMFRRRKFVLLGLFGLVFYGVISCSAGGGGGGGGGCANFTTAPNVIVTAETKGSNSISHSVSVTVAPEVQK